jgi:hypothetical protein
MSIADNVMFCFFVVLMSLAVLSVVFVIYITFKETRPTSNKLPKPKNYPPCPPYKITYNHRIFENNIWTTAICYGTSDEIAEQMSEWNKITDKNLAEYKKSAKIRDIIALRKKLKERHNA